MRHDLANEQGKFEKYALHHHCAATTKITNMYLKAMVDGLSLFHVPDTAK
jgi:hypothetical protein